MKLGMRKIARAQLAQGELLTVQDGEASTIRIDCGCVCITEEKSFIGHVLIAGQRYTFDRPGVAIVAAQTDARVTLLAARLGPARVSTATQVLYAQPWWERMVGALG